MIIDGGFLVHALNCGYIQIFLFYSVTLSFIIYVLSQRCKLGITFKYENI